ncbi:Crp/Fnr family transcriptional regulator [Sphingobacterium mizutaii NBRC 14946 = DSM 11724]|uniref:Nitrogen-responsive regulatory protein n=2 Tax=Sphingobacterium mizutaii TaxID=1010 RepID=A0AAJ4XCJ8_9SPHI|nr:Crp/Fnr family transcriptional regulator [Sphingobacterium mizutaii]GEM70184.1 Crp/Fnr family transcriptional regulator [Sphingobacterium mizutaii NBRC 14946 = DSM 11724]SDL13821.1 CRP/FNR family transcriptional regulator, anaerobic regulatory protein [Sphingobacterium mizutaii]SNV51983.1 Nitrogen-responsive regulatory protein [Sphingobacterium mizutaii]
MSNKKFDFLLEQGLRAEFDQVGIKLDFNTGDIIIEPNKYIKVIPILLKGTIKVIRETNEGNELILYYIKAGQSCAVSLSTSLMNKLSNIKAIAEEKVELIAIPSSTSVKWYDSYASWRMFVLRTMDNRYDEIINTLDSVAFKKIDERLMDYLKAKTEAVQSNILNITHQEIANELSTSREVISRSLKQLEQKGILKLFRNKVEIFSPM